MILFAFRVWDTAQLHAYGYIIGEELPFSFCVSMRYSTPVRVVRQLLRLYPAAFLNFRPGSNVELFMYRT